MSLVHAASLHGGRKLVCARLLVMLIYNFVVTENARGEVEGLDDFNTSDTHITFFCLMNILE